MLGPIGHIPGDIYIGHIPGQDRIVNGPQYAMMMNELEGLGFDVSVIYNQCKWERARL